MKESFRKKYGPWALVAGAGEGLGAAFCRSLARRGLNIILVDVKTDPMVKLSQELEAKADIQCLTIPLDLNEQETVGQLLEIMQHKDCKLLVYNAAHGPVQAFLDNTPKELDRHLQINARTPLHLVYGFAQHLVKHQKTGGIILMSSLAGLFGTQLVATYGATKAFNYNLGEALFHELKPHGIDVLACCAGAMDTPNYQNTNPRYGLLKPKVMKPKKVSEKAVKTLGKKGLVIPGFSNRLNYFILSRLLPRPVASRLFNRTMKKMYE